MRAFRELFQRVYYWKFYQKVAKKGKHIKLSKGGSFNHAEQITMGSNIFISNNFNISAYKLTFGNNIMVGPNLVIECTNHKMDTIGVSMFEIAKQKIREAVTIENDVWMGANVTILPGVKISEGCVIGAGSIVTKNLPPYSICVGTPCRPIKKRFSDSDMQKHLNLIQKSKYKFEEVFNQWRNFNL